MTPALAFSVLLGAVLLGLALRTGEQRRRAPALPPPSDFFPLVTAILPVRDEEQNVLPCVNTLLAQTARPGVLVVDDGSTDATAALVAERAAGEPRLRLLAAGPLPEKWPGKVHALWAGSREAGTPWILTTDADTRHAPDLLARALAAAQENRLDGVSLAGHQETRGLGENLLIPAVFALLDTFLGDWRAVAASEGAPVANGQFLLLRREAWERCGGFESVRSAPLDDVAVAARLRSCGYRTGFFRAPGLSVRMYRGWAEAFRGWRRILGGFLGSRTGTVAAILAVLLLPATALGAALLTGRWVEATLLWGAGAAASALFRSGSGHSPVYGLLYPLDSLALAAVLAQSVADRRRGKLASWKGREMKI
ncbi:MAG TPA: glycosyltransferase family 2 protein [Thermoanaerobaculia bacterium]|nr:glycosyltransferase family 2 protein [Thermoanaerobaculia bacterium]